jgi:hypothetical protein
MNMPSSASSAGNHASPCSPPPDNRSQIQREKHPLVVQDGSCRPPRVVDREEWLGNSACSAPSRPPSPASPPQPAARRVESENQDSSKLPRLDRWRQTEARAARTRCASSCAFCLSPTPRARVPSLVPPPQAAASPCLFACGGRISGRASKGKGARHRQQAQGGALVYTALLCVGSDSPGLRLTVNSRGRRAAATTHWRRM